MKENNYTMWEYWQEVNFISEGSDLWCEIFNALNEEKPESLQLDYLDVAEGVDLNNVYFNTTPYKGDNYLLSTNDGIYNLSKDSMNNYKVFRKITFDDVRQSFEDDPAQNLSFDMVALKLKMQNVI